MTNVKFYDFAPEQSEITELIEAVTDLVAAVRDQSEAVRDLTEAIVGKQLKPLDWIPDHIDREGL